MKLRNSQASAALQFGLHLGIALCVLSLNPVASAKTDVRALVSRPHETTLSKERNCRADSDCVPIQCLAPCAFDGAANKKFAAKIIGRCVQERKKNGENRAPVTCTESSVAQTTKCKKRKCQLVESIKGAKPVGKIERPDHEESDSEGE